MSALSTGRFRFGPVLAGTIVAVLLLLLLGSTAEIFLLLFLAVLFSLYLGSIADAISRRTQLDRRLAVALAVLVSLIFLATDIVQAALDPRVAR